MLLEILLLVALVGLAFLMDAHWPWNPKGILIIGGAILSGSYIHMILAGGIASWIAEVLRRRAGMHD